MFRKSRIIASDTIDESVLEHLPGLVKSYLTNIGIVGKKPVKTVRLEQTGHFRMKPLQKWLPLKGEQYIVTDPPGFIWYGNVKTSPLVSVSAVDSYRHGHGSLLAKMMSLFTVTNASGSKIDQSELMRYLAEMVWYPTAWIGENVRWDVMDVESAKVTLTDRGITAVAIVYFDREDRIYRIMGYRYKESDSVSWSAEVSDYREVDGILIPHTAEVMWNLKTGDFSYFKATISNITFNQPFTV